MLAEQRRVPLVDALGPAREPHRQRAVATTVRSPDGRPPRRSHGTASWRRSGWSVRLHHLADRDAGLPQRARRSRRPTGPGTTPPGASSIRSCAPTPSGRGRERRVGGPRRVARAPRAGRVHCSSVATAIATQQSSRPYVVGPGGLVEVLRRRARPAVAGPLEQRAVGGVLDHLLGGDVERGIDHRRLDEAAFAGPVAVLEREQQAEQRVQPGVGVADAVRLEREQVGMSRSAR